MHCPESLGDCHVGTGSVLSPLYLKASSVFLSLFLDFSTNEVTKGKEAKSTFPSSAKNVFKLPSYVIPPTPTVSLHSGQTLAEATLRSLASTWEIMQYSLLP